MKTYRCICGNSVFYDNTQCLRCARALGFCPGCRSVTSLLPMEDGHVRCGQASCGIDLAKCSNYTQHAVCNRCLALPIRPEGGGLCDCCRFNATIPDLGVPGNLKKWSRLEAAKRRLFYDLSQLGLPYGTAADGITPPLSFDFKADLISKNDFWRSVGKAEKVYTGHCAGRITINIREADDVEREKLRVDLGEAQRTLIGHFRHEIGHFYWDVLVKGRREDQCKAVFGDHTRVSYADALNSYYQSGPPMDWAQAHISAYATMHPWEDFAETWATYLDMISTLDTAHQNVAHGESDPLRVELDALVLCYQRLGVALNEFSRGLGLLDFVPEVFAPPVIAKLRFLHDLARSGRAENGALAATDLPL